MTLCDFVCVVCLSEVGGFVCPTRSRRAARAPPREYLQQSSSTSQSPSILTTALRSEQEDSERARAVHRNAGRRRGGGAERVDGPFDSGRNGLMLGAPEP